MRNDKQNTTDDERQREAYVRWIAGQLPACTLDELRVIAVRVERLSQARPQYGGLDLKSDGRDFVRERAMENIDRAFYDDCIYVKRQDEERERLREEAAAELAAVGDAAEVASALDSLTDFDDEDPTGDALPIDPSCDCWRGVRAPLEITGHVADCPRAHRRAGR